MVTPCKGSNAPGNMAATIGRLACRECLLTVALRDTGAVMPEHVARRAVTVDGWADGFRPEGGA